MIGVTDFFDLSEFPFKELFGGLERVWDALPRIRQFIESRGGFEILGTVMPGAFLEGDTIYIGRNSVVEPGALIRGRVLIGDNCEIRQGAYIRGDAVIGNGCVVGHTTEVKNAVFLNGAKAGHFAYVGDSILGGGCNLGAGTKLANFKMDTGDRTVSVTLPGGGRVSTGLRKMGAIIGDNADLGCNSVTMPGTLIGPRSLVYPNATVRGCLPADSVLKVVQNQQIVSKR